MQPYPGCTRLSILMHPLLIRITFSAGGHAICDAPKAQGGAIFDAPKPPGGAIFDAPKPRGGAIFDAPKAQEGANFYAYVMNKIAKFDG